MSIGTRWRLFTAFRRRFPFRSLAKALAVALLISPVPLVGMTSDAPAQVTFSVGFGYFQSALAPYGTWYHHPRWGDVWRPARVEIDFRPYYRGHWEYSRPFGWVWASDYVWGDIPFHYGRWVYDPYDGWLWIPGYVWGPAWVIWRSGGGYIGWFPMPPDDGFLFGSDLFRTRWDNWDRAYGYYDWYGPNFGPNMFISFWIFVDDRHFADRDYIRYIPPRNEFTRIVNTTVNVTNYVTVNNYIVNRSVDVERIERAAGRRIAALEPRDVVRRGMPVTTVDVGRRIEDSERSQHVRDPNASPRDRISSLPDARARGLLPPAERLQGPIDRERERERPGTLVPPQPRDRATERARPSEPSVRPSEPSARLEDRAPRIERPQPELRRAPTGQTPAQSGTEKRIDRGQKSSRDDRGKEKEKGAATR